MSESVLITLPVEIEQLAQNVSVEKRNEVQSVLNHVFNGVSKMREQLDLVVVADENDKTSMVIANKIRLGVRQVRLDAEKEFDLKRSEVQQAMLSFKTEDQLWLKAKQTMQILTKEIEETAKWKESTKERIEAERKELKTQERIIKISKFNSEITRGEFENMSDSMFDLFFAGIEKQYNDRIEAEKQAEIARLEKERIQKLGIDRKNSILKLWKFITPEYENMNMGELSDEQWNDLNTALIESKKAEDVENERVRLENERLQKEAELKEVELKAEQEKAEKARIEAEKKAKIEKEKAEEERRLLQEKADKGAKIQAEIAAKQLKEQQAKQKVIEDAAKAERLKAETERKKLESELQAKKDAELKAKQESERKEKERIEAEQKAAKAPDKEKLTKWVESLNIATPELTDLSAIVIATDISDKFEAFKIWANKQIERL